MIPRDYITAWRSEAPWVQDFQVEQDLIVSKALVELFSEPLLRNALGLRGSTTLSARRRRLYAATSSAPMAVLDIR